MSSMIKIGLNLFTTLLDCWILSNSHVGPPMVVHGQIRDDPDFIRNKITINWILSL